MNRSEREPWSASETRLPSITSSGKRTGQPRRRAAASASAASPGPTHADSKTRLRAQSAVIGSEIGRALRSTRGPRNRGAGPRRGSARASRDRPSRAADSRASAAAGRRRRAGPRAPPRRRRGSRAAGAAATARPTPRRVRAPAPSTARKVWFVAPSPQTKNASASRPAERCCVPAPGGPGCEHDEEGVQRVHALHVGLRPEARSEGEQQRREQRGDRIQPRAPAQKQEQRRAGSRGAGGGEEAHAPGDRSERQARASRACRAARRADSRSGAGCRAGGRR